MTFHDLGIISVYVNFAKIFVPFMVGRDLAPSSSLAKIEIFGNFKLMQLRHLKPLQDDVGRILKNGKNREASVDRTGRRVVARP